MWYAPKRNDMRPLIREERQKLCAELRNPNERDFVTCDRAANEIEILAAEVARLKDENGVLMEKMTNMLDMMVR